MQADADGPGRLAEYRYVVGVSAERPDVLLDPVEGHQLVEQAGVARRVGVPEAEEPERPDAVSDGNEDYLAERGEHLIAQQQQNKIRYDYEFIDQKQVMAYNIIFKLINKHKFYISAKVHLKCKSKEIF